MALEIAVLTDKVLFSTGNQTQWNDITTLATAPTLTGVGQLTDGGSLELAGASSVFIQGDYAYVAARDDNGLQVIDISDPSSPTGVGQLTNGGSLELNNPQVCLCPRELCLCGC